MSSEPITQNTLFYGDNLPILRDYFQSQSIDLIYLDPPFNSNRSYNVLFKEESGQESEAQITAFEDAWHWDKIAAMTYHELIQNASLNVVRMIGALREFIGENQMMAYLVMMTARLVELHRVLKTTGSLYLHCDPTASHYLKIILDTIFGPLNFKNEIVWKRTTAHSSSKRYGPIHDILFFYSKTEKFIWNPQHTPYSQDYIEKFYRQVDKDNRHYTLSDLTAAGIRHGSSGLPWHGIDITAKGNHWKFTIENLEDLNKKGRIYWPPGGGMPRYIRYLDELKGIVLQDIIDDIMPIGAQAAERLGYPTQKPLTLLERIIQASSNPGDIVLDPFCGCGTAITAAQKLNRRWIGIDITHLAITLQKYRLKNSFNILPGKDYRVIGEPSDYAAAEQLARDNRYQFQWWALSLVGAKPISEKTSSKAGKKGKDRGIDGIISFIDDTKDTLKSIVIQVKSGKVKPGDIRDLNGVVERENAAIGVFISLEHPTQEMEKEASSVDFYTSQLWQKSYPRIQILTIKELLEGKQIQMPPSQVDSFKSAEKIKIPAKQTKLDESI